MQHHDVTVELDVYCKWADQPPRYRAFVNGELFTERTWIWDENHHLEEALAIRGPPGIYTIQYSLVPGFDQAEISVKNIRLVYGAGAVNGSQVEIYHVGQ